MVRVTKKALPIESSDDLVPAPSNARSSSRLATRRTRHSLSKETEDIDELSSNDSPNLSRSSSSRRLLKAVTIRTMAATKNKGRSKAPSTAQSSPSQSNKSSRTQSMEYETPMTSVSTSPAEPVPPKSLAESSNTRARKRPRRSTTADVRYNEEEGDAALARALQEEEYAKVGGFAQMEVDEDDEDFNIDESEPENHLLPPSDDEDDGFEVTRPPPKKQRLARRKGAGKKPVTPSTSKRFRPLGVSRSIDDSDALDFYDDMLDDGSEDFSDSSIPVSGLHSKVPIVVQKRLQKLKSELEKAKARGDEDENLEWLKQRVEMQEYRIQNPHLDEMNVWDRKKAMNRIRLERNHPGLKTMWSTLEEVPIIQPVEAAQPEAINRKLKSFQLQGLDWMVKQEKTHYKGGLLGDEMGMGKTIQAVSLIMSDYPANAPSLVVVPPVALMQWASEIKEYTDGRLNVLVFHGTNTKTKNMKVKELKKFDVIIVSYNSLESLHRKETKGWSRGETIVREASPLHNIKFHRLILDEAHSIKSRTTGVAKACFALQGKYKWCLSGTPVQNRIGEFFSLLRFLEVRPFADYFCRSCKCEQLHWSLDEDHMCPHCKHSGAEHVSVFNQELLNPITGDDIDLREDALAKLHMITARMMLRRLKKDHTSSMELPPKEIVIHNEFFGEIEHDFSNSIMTNSTRKFDTYVAQGVMLNNYANIFGLIMQMRQVANHPDLLLKKHAEGGQNVLVCVICADVAEQAIRSRCHHEFCRSCVREYIKAAEGAGGSADCPSCHIALSIDLEQPSIEQDEDLVKKTSIINRIKMENWTSSTKIEMLVYDLYKLRSKKQTLKSIVFSQFTSMLQLIEWRLRRAGFKTVMLDGSMTPAQRQKSIEYFMKNADVEVFLVSLKAGGVALNLTEASRVFIVDPWWNPAAEWQSADRCHRIGQKRPCVITRLVIEDSVESRMVLLQEKKAAMISGTINNDKVAMEKLTPEDLQFLFRGT